MADKALDASDAPMGIGASTVAKRFRGFLPVVIDVETAGFNAATDALLEIAAVTVKINYKYKWCIDDIIACHVQPFDGANLEPSALEFTGIDPHHPFRQQIAVSENEALDTIFTAVKQKMKVHHCNRAILVGHNASFDLGFLTACVKRNKIKRSPFHPFSTLDTATMGGLAYGQTVLSRSVLAAGLEWDAGQAHSARYDAERTALLFCKIVNQWNEYSGLFDQ